MLTVGRRRTARLAAAALASGLLAMGTVAGAGSAVADGGAAPAAGGPLATLGALGHYETATIHDGNGSKQVPAVLLDLSVKDGGKLSAYCIDINRETDTGAAYQETAWNQSVLAANPDAGKVEWVLQNAYPKVDDLTQLGNEAGVKGLSQLDAEAGTQVAIWTYSDHVNVTADNANAEKLAKYLIAAAAQQNASEPGPSLTVAPAVVSGKSGSKLGPVTVHTNGSSAQVSLSSTAPAGVKLVDSSGKPVTTATDGEQLYVDVPAGTAAGSTTVQVQSTTTVPVGRAFNGTLRGAEAQTLILAGSSASTVSSAATATWAMQGPIPAVAASVDCAKSGVDLTSTNAGDQPFTYTVGGKQYTVAPGKSQTVLVPETEGKTYSIAVTGSNGFSKTFTGLLNCKVTGSGGAVASPTTSASAAPAPSAASGGTNLAETGSSSATPVIAGVAVLLVVVGGGTVFFLRKRKAGSVG
ncbi:LAETG motif-containing sortase-dependent surface protein [Streptantibioticus silvisoli]|uniref:LAETG motif-containing sortase-dependent surface protein n=1 Tax=Streptantibioticus silvisoli TaxID=2705255 RepID=A0ABT6W957_9ACTN|nr:LAETG motif-containing sortase-dependent surface protein [Streptantibioticus silvisoli]MDI5967291.1 LAETG motif-containing sortase-dependent surface protein [Streptantibioticus silvisoli]